ncbi:unnamed protein product [Protopolystoma xenopodis]|uniref:Uncharacterized protein n=1 Tax=Protopolystoma xenopodis TaxID=117903 RepID=A0A3S5BV54_9PLAT|nr:unnamed protein product [Protopolystoma xenopodis]
MLSFFQLSRLVRLSRILLLGLLLLEDSRVGPSFGKLSPLLNRVFKPKTTTGPPGLSAFHRIPYNLVTAPANSFDFLRVDDYWRELQRDSESSELDRDWVLALCERMADMLLRAG